MIKICENCNSEHNGNYGSGRFCSTICARGFSTKNKRKEINEKISKSLIGSGHSDVKIICTECKTEFEVIWKKRNQKYCSFNCAKNGRLKNPSYLEKNRQNIINRCKNPKERERLRDIGRKGGFGKKGYTNDGVYYESLFEKESFEFLELNKVSFQPHKHIPNSSKVSDIFLPDFNLWIELDGINRELRQKWLGKQYKYWIEKLNIYKREKLNVKIFTDLKSFKEFILTYSLVVQSTTFTQ